MRPICSTAYTRRGSAGVEATAVSAARPRAYGRTDSCCCARTETAASTGTSISVKLPRRAPFGSNFYLVLKQDVSQLVFLAGLQDRQDLVARPELRRADCNL